MKLTQDRKILYGPFTFTALEYMILEKFVIGRKYIIVILSESRSIGFLWLLFQVTMNLVG